jgi:hypothetical protein
LGCCTRGQETARNCTFVPLGRWLLSLMLNRGVLASAHRMLNIRPMLSRPPASARNFRGACRTRHYSPTNVPAIFSRMTTS